jgi:adenine-specific DNA-methyltransferase
VGNLVANRKQHRLHSRLAPGRRPLVWVAAVRQDGTFDFDRGRLSRQAAGRGYVDVTPGATYVISEECIVLQRASSRSQARRLVAALIPWEFVRQHRGVVGENHTILLIPVSADAVPADRVVELLNSPEASVGFGRVGGSASISVRLLDQMFA